jgi:dsRNA-specific ribonuclease
MQILELNGWRERGENSKDRPSKRMRLVPTSELFEGLEKLEEILNHEFRYKNLLLEALTYSRKIAVFRPCYERFKNLGDAFLGIPFKLILRTAFNLMN